MREKLSGGRIHGVKEAPELDDQGGAYGGGGDQFSQESKSLLVECGEVHEREGGVVGHRAARGGAVARPVCVTSVEQFCKTKKEEKSNEIFEINED